MKTSKFILASLMAGVTLLSASSQVVNAAVSSSSAFPQHITTYAEIPEYITTYNAETQTAEVNFIANGTTGYSWQYVANQEGIIKETSNYYKSDPVPEGWCGCGGRQIWDFKGLKEGSTTVKFTYLQPWDPSSIAQRIILDFTVDKNLNVTVKGINSVN